MHDIVDLRSDTLTLPTPEMREAMARAEVGDDVWGEDPTVQRLESMAAARLGKEAAVFVASGTMGNLVSVVAHTQAGQEVVLDLDSHIYNYEVAGGTIVGNVQMRPVKTERGFLTPEQVQESIRPSNIHIPQTGLVCLENTHNRHGGTCMAPPGLRVAARRSSTARGSSRCSRTLRQSTVSKHSSRPARSAGTSGSIFCTVTLGVRRKRLRSACRWSGSCSPAT